MNDLLSSSSLLVLHLAVTGYMTGLIWFVQLVHYPLMGEVGAEGYERYQERHMRLTTWAVSPMLLELASAIGLFFASGVSLKLSGLGLGLLVVIWATTALASVPAHARLSSGFDAQAHRGLVRTNWLRTAGWSARLLLSAWLVLSALG